MAIRVESPTSAEGLAEFLAFHDEVYAPRRARWPAFVPFQLPTLTGKGPFARDRRLRPFVVRDGDRLAARALAVVDARYQRHWGERLGHVSLFEALPDSGPATRALLDAACAWLAAEGAEAARAGFGLLDFPFPIDAYETLPPSWLRQSPAYYHALLKDAGFETEQGWVDYKIAATPELVARWERMVAAMPPAGITLVPLADLPAATRMAQLAAVWNESFARHWGFIPFTETELETVFELFAPSGMLESSVLAFEGREAVGALWYGPDASAFAVCAPGRTLAPAERLNTLGIAVRAPARGRGVNLAMAAHAFLGSVRQGATHLSYTLVLDDNWPSRRTAEKLGASVCGNYVTYRRTFRRR
jgi:hypothetical protein